MIDLHNHLLPGIDDGAGDMAEALELARMAVGGGITHLVCTPHMHFGRYDNTRAGIAQALGEFRAALAAEAIPLEVAAAAEVRFDMEIMIGHARGELPYVGRWQGSEVLLLEFPHGEIPFGAERLTQWLLDRGVVPLIAHPERNKGVMRSPSRLKAFIDQGCLLQVTAGAVSGRFGARAQELAEELIREGSVTLIASDAHNVTHRPPLMREGFEAVARLVGDVRAEELAITVPWRLAECHFA